MAEYVWIGREYNTQSLYKSMSTYWEIFRTGQRSKMECFGKLILVFNCFCKKTPSEISERVLNMCRVLNMLDFWIFLNFRKYGRVLNMLREAIMKEFWIFQDSEYARFLHMQELCKFLNMVQWCPTAELWIYLVNISRGFK